MPREIKAWVTEDGLVHTDLDDAIDHEDGLAVRRDLESFFEEYVEGPLDIETTVEVCIDHLSELREILRKRS